MSIPRDKKETCQCEECKIKLHCSDCAVHNKPAEPKGKCNCNFPDPFISRTLAKFDKNFPKIEIANWGRKRGDGWKSSVTAVRNIKNDVEDFIRSALNAQREEMREKVESLKTFGYDRNLILKDQIIKSLE